MRLSSTTPPSATRAAGPPRPGVAATRDTRTARRFLLAATLALLVTTALPAAAITPAPEPLPQTPTVDITEQVVHLTFPVADPGNGVHFSDDFLQLRGGGSRLHAATDLTAPKHRPIHAAVGGTISFAPYGPDRDGYSELGEPSYGWMLTIQGDDGLRYSYVHLNNDTKERDADGTWLDDDAGGLDAAFAPRIAAAIADAGRSLSMHDGLRVERGELIGYNGDSGNAKGVPSHLHFEIHVVTEDGSHRINPYHSLKAALARGDVPGNATPSPVVGPYRDLDRNGTHTSAILTLTDAGIVRACGPERYCPHTAVTRDDIAAAVSATLGLDERAALRARGGTGFDDVPAWHRDAGAIAAVAHAGVLTGYGDGRFGPDDPLSRQQLATTLVQGFQLPPAQDRSPFVDVRDDAVHGSSIASAHRSGLTQGCGDGTRYCGLTDVTRGQIATFLHSGMAWTTANG